MLVVTTARADDAPPLVELATVGEAGDAVSARVESWFRGQVPVARKTDPEPRTLPRPAEHSGIRVWIALENEKTTRVLFAVQRRPGQAPRYLVSDVPVDEGLDELGVERLGQIIYLSAMALWEGEVESSPEEVKQWLTRRVPETPPPPPPPPVRPAPAAPQHWTMRVGAEYAATAGGDEGVSQTVGADVAALYQHGDWKLGPRARAAVIVPHEVTTSGVTLDLHGASFATSASLVRKVRAHVSVPAEVGVALDIVRYRASAFADPSFHAGAGGSDVRPLAYARCGVRIDVGTIALDLVAIGDVDFVHAHYDVANDGRQSAVITPWQVRPGVAAGASW